MTTLPTAIERAEKAFVEEGAALEHDRWAKWQKYFFDQCISRIDQNGYLDLGLPVPKYERWMRQIETKYADLSEQEKESDRKEVRAYLPLLRHQLTALALEFHRGEVERLEKMKKKPASVDMEEHERGVPKGYNQALSDSITYHTAAIEEIKKLQ